MNPSLYSVRSSAFRDETHTSGPTDYSNTFPYETIKKDTGYGIARTKSMPNRPDHVSDPYPEDETLQITIVALNDKGACVVNKGDFAFAPTGNLHPLSYSINRGPVPVANPETSRTMYYPTQAFGAQNTRPVRLQSLADTNKRLRDAQLAHYNNKGIDLSTDAVYIEELLSIQELLKLGVPVGYITQENPEGLSEMKGPSKQIPTTKLCTLCVEGMSTVKNLHGRTHVSMKIGFALVLMKVGLDQVYDNVPRVTNGRPELAASDIHRPTPGRYMVGDSLSAGYSGNTSLDSAESRLVHANVIGPYMFQWVPVNDRFGTATAPLRIRQILPVVRTLKVGPRPQGYVSVESVAVGCYAPVATVMTGGKGTDDGSSRVHRDYNAIPTTEQIVVHIERLGTQRLDVFELPERHIIAHLAANPSFVY